MITKQITSPEAMERLGAELAQQSQPGSVIFLQGDLGAGKTTLVRGFLRQLGFTGTVKSPTYGFIELYTLKQLHIVHCDLYRLQTPEGLHHVGLSDYLTEDAICLIEWPEKAEALLPNATLYCQIIIEGEQRKVFVSKA